MERQKNTKDFKSANRRSSLVFVSVIERWSAQPVLPTNNSAAASGAIFGDGSTCGAASVILSSGAGCCTTMCVISEHSSRRGGVWWVCVGTSVVSGPPGAGLTGCGVGSWAAGASSQPPARGNEPTQDNSWSGRSKWKENTRHSASGSLGREIK